MIYRIYYGNSVPFNYRDFSAWQEATTFMRARLEEGTAIHSVSREKKDD